MERFENVSSSDDLGAATTARAREFWMCWRRFNWVFGRL